MWVFVFHMLYVTMAIDQVCDLLLGKVTYFFFVKRQIILYENVKSTHYRIVLTAPAPLSAPHSSQTTWLTSWSTHCSGEFTHLPAHQWHRTHRTQFKGEHSYFCIVYKSCIVCSHYVFCTSTLCPPSIAVFPSLVWYCVCMYITIVLICPESRRFLRLSWQEKTPHLFKKSPWLGDRQTSALIQSWQTSLIVQHVLQRKLLVSWIEVS